MVHRSRKSGLGGIARAARTYHPDGMVQSEWDKAIRELNNQELALFARRAHRRLGRGFVLSDVDEPRPVYITWMVGAPPTLIDAVLEYDPECEAVVVSEDEHDEEKIVIDCVKIQRHH
jgi:hypothetical protein